MKVGVIIPDRGDRPELLSHCLKMIESQTMKAYKVFLVDFKPKSKTPDLTKRIRKGFELAKDSGCDCVLIMENDDYYSKDYIETMVNAWIKEGRPELLGVGYTYYYHIFKRQYNKLIHPSRASLMNTLISCDTIIKYPSDDYIYLDLILWHQLRGATFIPKEPISIGIKHGIGLCGGNGHNAMIYKNNDFELDFLNNHVDEESFYFYLNLKNA